MPRAIGENRPGSRWKLLFSFRIPLRFLRGSYSHLVLTVIALGCGVALVCAIDLVNRAVLHAFVEIIDTMAGRAALQVSAGESGLFPEEIAQKVSSVPGVELAVPVVNAAAFTTDDSGEMLTVQGVDVMSDAVVRVYDAHDQDGLKLDDPLVFLSQPDSIMLTRAFASRRGLKLDDRITLETPTGRRVFVIRGLLEAKGVARVFGGNLVVMDLYAAEAAFARPGFVSRVDVVLQKKAEVAATSAAIAAVLPSGLRVEAPGQRKADLHKLMESFDQLLQGVSLIVLIAAFLIAYNRLTTVFEARSWQLGVLRAGGVRRGVLWRELLKESLLLGVAGVALGVPLGIALGRLLLPAIATATALGNNLVAPEAELGTNTAALARAVILGMAAASLAAMVPARNAARQSVVAVIQGRGIELANPSLRLAWLVRCVVLIGAAVGIVAQVATRSISFGLAATLLLGIGTALDARLLVPIVRLPSLLRSTHIGQRLGPSLLFAAGQLLPKPRRVALTVGTLGVGLGAVFWLYIVARSLEHSVLRVSSSAFRADLIVTSSFVSSGFLESPISDQILDELGRVSGVAGVGGQRVISWHYRDQSIMLTAADPSYFSDDRFGRFPLVGSQIPDVWNAVARGEAVLASESFATTFNVRVGDQIALDTPSGVRHMRIGGFTTEMFLTGALQISRTAYCSLWHDHKVTRAFVLKGSGVSTLDLRNRIVAELGKKYRLRVLMAAELVEYFGTQVRRAFGAIPILAGLVLSIVLVGLADSLAANVAERTRELGTLRALGVRASYLWRLVLVEAMALGVLGLALALLLGSTLGIFWVVCIFPILVGGLELSFPVLQIAFVAFATLVVCAVAALIPGSRASRLEPAVALRYE
jgi:putative ABC transport system permease protein